jgi:hypothetical protein
METNITINDIIMMVNIIDACSERGAFKGNELASVGTLRDKLATFVRENKPEDETETEPTEGAE